MVTVAAAPNPTTKSRGKRIAALDGWRGLAILMVIAEHVQMSYAGHPLARWTGTGQHGVTIFFVLSGFLITSTLLDHSCHLKSFYGRRFFRLMPAAWLYLAVMLLLNWHFNVQFVTKKQLLACLFFYRNYFPRGIPTEHFWSLSLEEQFYFVWPITLLLCGARRAKWVAILGAVGIAVWRASNWAHYSHFPYYFRTEARADALLIGCALGLLLRESGPTVWAIRWSRVLFWPALGIVIGCIALFPNLPPLVENLCIATLIAATVLHRDTLPTRFLAWKPLAWLGTVSYSLYLWQGLFALRGWSWPASCYILLLGVATFYWVERPLISVGSRLLKSHSPGV